MQILRYKQEIIMRTFFKTVIVFILTWEARRVLKTWRPFIVLVSGSVGKTTTKDAVYHVLKDSIATRKSEKSFNSEIGVPLTILGLENAWSSPLAWLKNIWLGFRVPRAQSYPKLLVLEVGSDHPGDIARLMKWLTPDIAVVTSDLKNIWLGFRVPRAQSYPKLLVLEVGSDHPGDIARLMKWLTPDIAVVT